MCTRAHPERQVLFTELSFKANDYETAQKQLFKRVLAEPRRIDLCGIYLSVATDAGTFGNSSKVCGR